MGKKTRKTRWRTLTITDEPSDSEESSTTTAQRLPKGYYPKSYYNKFSYSSQSTPRRRFQHDDTKSTRSSSTTSENKITFNEDEYTRITTPRQDVLFKKGYLNKPKNYQTQTSTGTSTTSTGNSTGNGTPDHQSTDLDYESQFVFPNGFVDQNGIYYVNGYESYPLMVYNPPTYYPEFSNRKSKRYSTGSLTESMSPNNEEATSQDLSGGEASNNVSDYSGHHPLYNMIYPGYYVNEVCPTHDIMNGQSQTDPARRIKKRIRRKTSKSQTAQDSSEYTEDESDSGDEEKRKIQPVPKETLTNGHSQTEEAAVVIEENPAGIEINEDTKLETEEIKSKSRDELEAETELTVEISTEVNGCTSDDTEEKEESIDCLKNGRSSPEVHQTSETTENLAEGQSQNSSTECTKSNLKPDAEEFVPRAYRSSETSMSFLKVPPNFVPIPVLPLGEFNGQNFNPAFIPPGIPINFLPPDPKIFPNYVGFVQSNFLPKIDAGTADNQSANPKNTCSQTNKEETCDNSNAAKDDVHQNKELVEKIVVQNVNNKTIDIATIVSKLEEAAKEQDQDTMKTKKQHEETQNSPQKKFSENKYSKTGQKYKNYRRNYYNSPQTSPQKKYFHTNTNNNLQNDAKSDTYRNEEPSEQQLVVKIATYKCDDIPNGIRSTEIVETAHEIQKVNSPEKIKRTWKQHYQNGNPKWHQNNTVKDHRYKQNGKMYNDHDIKDYKIQRHHKNYSEILLNKTQSELKYPKESGGEKQKIQSTKETIIESPNKIATSPTKKLNQWISVSNKKKRKNKNTDENDTIDDYIDVQLEEEKEEHSNAELFESYDVNLLVDVVPLADNEVIKIEAPENAEDNVTQSETNPMNGTKEDPSDTNETQEEEGIIKLDVVEAEPTQIEPTEALQDEIPVIPVNETATEIVELPELNAIPTQPEPTDKTKKKNKKGTQKPATKRVIITDLDLSMNNEEIKTPIKKIVTKMNDTKIVNKKIEENQEHNKEQEVVDKLVNGNEEEKKKSKKKKKKPSKMTTSVSSLSSSNTTINVTDDSYDFLLDTALSDETVEKTNIEISQELDKLIQRGMYNSLEGKIKSLNIDESDGFFKSIFNTISSRESSVEKTGYAQTPDLSKILQNTRKLCPSSSVSRETNSQNKDINTVLPNLDSPDEDGLFLENTNLNDIPQDRTVTNDADNEETKTEEPNKDCNPISEDAKLETDAETKSYPITQAVKEWMNKTRERTPDVVLLKSPSAIYKEFCESANSESDTDSKNLSPSDGSNTAVGEEITIYTQEERVVRRETDSKDVGIFKTSNEHSESTLLNGKSDENLYIEEGEDAVEVYESKYGKNEDYLQLQKEIRGKTNSSNYPQNKNMPYKAICCSIV